MHAEYIQKYFHKSLICLEYFSVILNIQADVPECLTFSKWL